MSTSTQLALIPKSDLSDPNWINAEGQPMTQTLHAVVEVEFKDGTKKDRKFVAYDPRVTTYQFFAAACRKCWSPRVRRVAIRERGILRYTKGG